MRSGFVAAALAVIIWGTNYSIAKRALVEIDPFAVAFARAAAGVVFFGALLAVRRRRGSVVANLAAGLRRALPLGLTGIFANQLFFMTGLHRTSAAHSAILIGLLPVFVLLLSSALHQERILAPRLAGILIAFAGVTLIALEHGVAFEAPSLAGDLLTMCGVLAFAGYTVWGKPVLKEYGPYDATALAFLTGGALILIVTLPAALRQDWAAVTPGAAACLGFVVIFSTIVAYILYYEAVSRLEPSKVAAFMYLQPIVAAIVAYVFLGERFSAAFLAGGILVLGGVLIAERA